MIRFLKPEFLDFRILVLLLIFIFLVLYFGLKRKYRTRDLWQNSRLKEISRFSSRFREISLYCLIVIVIGLTILSLSRPQLSTQKPIKTRLNIVGLVDNSWSEKVLDVTWQGKKVFRLDLVKEEMKQFIKDHIGKDKNSLALIAFGSKAFCRSYFTFDVSSLMFLTDYFNPKDFPPEGTDIAEALYAGIDMLDTIDKYPDVFKPTSNRRIFVMISDGEDNINSEDASRLESALSEVIKRKIPVYTIGIGSKEGGYIVEDIDSGGNFIYMTEDYYGGEKVFSRLQEETLKRIARITGGKYVYATTGDELSNAFKDVLVKEAEKEKKKEKDYYDIWQYLLGVAFVLCLLIIFLKPKN